MSAPVEDSLNLENNFIPDIDLALPENLRFCLIDVAQKYNPIFPPNEEYSFYVIVIEPHIKNASTFLQVSPRMKVLPCALGSRFKISPLSKDETINENNSPSDHNLHPSKRPKINISSTALVPTIPLQKIVNAIPKETEILLRISFDNFSLAEAKESSEALKRISILKKRLPKETDGNATETKEEWIKLMSCLDFKIIKIDLLNSGCELIWVNVAQKLPLLNRQTFLLENQNDQNTIKIKNYIKITFRTFFFGTDTVSVYKSPKTFEQISLNEGCWELADPNENKFPGNPFIVASSTDSSSPNYIITHSFFKGGLHCGHADENNPNEAAFCWSKYQLTGNSFQVLCGQSFKWEKIKGLEIPVNSVVGGRENTGEELFITKVESGGKIFIGKICATWLIVEENEKHLKCQYYNEKTDFTEDFEILVYCPSNAYMM